MNADPDDATAVVERLSLAAERLKALEEQAATGAALGRLQTATAELDSLREELGALRSRMERIASELTPSAPLASRQ